MGGHVCACERTLQPLFKSVWYNKKYIRFAAHCALLAQPQQAGKEKGAPSFFHVMIDLHGKAMDPCIHIMPFFHPVQHCSWGRKTRGKKVAFVVKKECVCVSTPA